jgi:hypothetical protein
MSDKSKVGITGDTCRGGITNTGVAAASNPRRWQIEWELPDSLFLSTLRDLMETVRGYGHVWLEHEDGFPKIFHAEFVTTPEYNEFDLADSLRDTAVTFDVYGAFPTRPAEVFGS